MERNDPCICKFEESESIRCFGGFFFANRESGCGRDFGIHLPDECVALVLEDPDLLDAAEGGEGLLEELLAQPDRDPAAVNGAVGRTRLVVHLVKGQGFGVGCNSEKNRVLNFGPCPFSRFRGAEFLRRLTYADSRYVRTRFVVFYSVYDTAHDFYTMSGTELLRSYVMPRRGASSGRRGQKSGVEKSKSTAKNNGGKGERNVRTNTYTTQVTLG